MFPRCYRATDGNVGAMRRGLFFFVCVCACTVDVTFPGLWSHVSEEETAFTHRLMLLMCQCSTDILPSCHWFTLQNRVVLRLKGRKSSHSMDARMLATERKARNNMSTLIYVHLSFRSYENTQHFVSTLDQCFSVETGLFFSPVLHQIQ